MSAYTLLLLLLALRFGNGWSSRANHVAFIASVLIGAALPAGIFIIVTTASGVFGDFIQSYLAQNYASMTGEHARFATAFAFMPESQSFFVASLIIGVACAFLALSCAIRFRSSLVLPKSSIAKVASAVGLLVVAWATVQAPHRDYEHYFLFLFAPVALVIGSLATLAESIGAITRTKLVAIAIAAYGIITCGFQIARADPAGVLHVLPSGSQDRIVERLRGLARRGDRAAIWGYDPGLYVDVPLRLGTRDSLAQFSIMDGPLRPYYRRRFLSDFERNKPRFFVDTTGPQDFAFPSRALYGVESFPELGHDVLRDYTLSVDIDHVRIYTRRS